MLKTEGREEKKEVELGESAEDVLRRRLAKSNQHSEKVKKMMASMGWTAGKGLGKDE